MDEEDERKDGIEKIFRVWHQPLDGWAYQVASVVKNQSTSADWGSIPGPVYPRRLGLHPWVGRSPGGGHGNPLQYSCLDSPMDREPGGLRLKGLSINAHINTDQLTTLERLTYPRGEKGQ